MFPFSKSRPETSLERISSSLRHVGEDIHQLLGTIGSEAGGCSAELRDRLRSFAGQAGEAGRQIEQQAAQQCESVSDFVKRRPFESLAVAFGLGMLLVAMKRGR